MQQCNAMWQLRLHDGLILHLLVLHYMWTVKYAMVGGKAEEIKCKCKMFAFPQYLYCKMVQVQCIFVATFLPKTLCWLVDSGQWT